MIYTNKTRRAMEIAYNAHHGQKDKSGVPYIYHPAYVAESMDTEEEYIVAILHDVVEDTDITFEELAREFSDTVIQALKLLTHDESIDYIDYIKNLKSNPIARKVKLADLKHNSDPTRLIEITDKDKKRHEKYKKAIKILEN